MILNYQDLLDSVWSTMKMKQDIDVTNLSSPLYAENKTKLSWPIWKGMIYDED